jgi:hypothetical protein
MVDTIVPNWFVGISKGALFSQESGGFCWSGGCYEVNLLVRWILETAIIFKVSHQMYYNGSSEL